MKRIASSLNRFDLHSFLGHLWHFRAFSPHRMHTETGQTSLNTYSNTLEPTMKAAGNLLDRFSRLVASKIIKPDPSQESAIKALALLQEYAVKRNQDKVVQPDPHVQASESPPVCGAYLYGHVGSGKTMCMDLFFKSLHISETNPRDLLQQTEQREAYKSQDTRLNRVQQGTFQPQPIDETRAPKKLHKLRLHFHEFMLFVHSRIHRLQESRPKVLGHSRQGLPIYRYTDPEVDPLDQVVKEVTTNVRVLCLDELHVTDVADAMILARLLEGMLFHGTLIVFTSNRPPKDLYKGGLSRKYFEPFIRMIEDTMAVMQVGSGYDYRELPSTTSLELDETMGKRKVGKVLQGSSSADLLKQTWQLMSQKKRWQLGGPEKLPVPFGRTLWIPSTASSQESANKCKQFEAAYFTFQQLCGNEGLTAALGPSDYLTICRTFPVIYIEEVPQFSIVQRDQARRFVAFLDILYEESCMLVCSTALGCTLDQVFTSLLAEAVKIGVNPNLGRSRRLEVHTPSKHAGSGPADYSPNSNKLKHSKQLLQEEVIMYHRASSRLTELCGEVVST